MRNLISIDNININQIDEIHRLANQDVRNRHQRYNDLRGGILVDFVLEKCI